jgi:hypothetical protein
MKYQIAIDVTIYEFKKEITHCHRGGKNGKEILSIASNITCGLAGPRFDKSSSSVAPEGAAGLLHKRVEQVLGGFHFVNLLAIVDLEADLAAIRPH